MTPSLIVSLAWLLSMLAAVAHGAVQLSRPVEVLELVLPLGVVTAMGLLAPPLPGSVAFLAALSAGWRLIHPGSARVDRILGGGCAGLATALYADHGVAIWVAVGLAAGSLAIGLVTVQDGRRAFGGVRNIALLAVALLGMLVGLAPDFAAGLQAASSLNRTLAPAQAAAVPTWAAAVVGVSVFLGIVRGFWVQR